MLGEKERDTTHNTFQRLLSVFTGEMDIIHREQLPITILAASDSPEIISVRVHQRTNEVFKLRKPNLEGYCEIMRR